MATPEANIPSARPSDVTRNHSNGTSARNPQNFNAFQLVSQLVNATPSYLFNMTSPFPGNFFSDLLRRMAPRAGTPSLSLDTTLQQHIRAALFTKASPHPVIPHNPLHPHMDLSALGTPMHSTIGSEKGVKRSLFSDVPPPSLREESSVKRARMDDSRDERRKPLEGLNPNFLLQQQFLTPAAVAPPPDLAHWNASASLLRPQMPMPGTGSVSTGPFDPYRLLLDLRLAGQLHTMQAATHALHNNHNKDPFSNSSMLSGQATNQSTNISLTPRETKPKEENEGGGLYQNGSLRGGETRVSAFHPPSRGAEPNEESVENRSTSSNSNSSCNSAGSRDSLGPQYIFKHLNEIYRSIDHHKPEEEEEKSIEVQTDVKKEEIKMNEDELLKRGGSAMPTQPRPIFPNVNEFPESPGNFKANITIKSPEMDRD